MTILIGLLLGVVFSICVTGIFYIGYKQGKKQIKHELDEEEVRKAQELSKGFQAVFNYDLKQVYQRKKVE